MPLTTVCDGASPQGEALIYCGIDNVSLRDPLWVVAIPKIGVSPPVQATPPSNAGIATVVTLLRNDVRGKTEKINKK